MKYILIALFILLASLGLQAQTAVAVSSTIPGLPPGMSFSSTGVLSGTPATAGVYQFAVTACDGETVPLCSAATVFQITVYSPVVIGTTSPLPSGAVGVAYVPIQFAASGGSGTFSWSAK